MLFKKIFLILTFTTILNAEEPVENTTPLVGTVNSKDLEECCKASNVNERCMQLCTTSVDRVFASEDSLLCLPYLQNLIYCASGGKDHTSCCQKRGVHDSCLDLCNGQNNHSIANMHTYTSCAITDLPIAFICFMGGLQPKSVENQPEEVSDAPITQTTTASCQDLGCLVPCEHGYVMGPNGCTTCTCINPCKDIICPVTMVCKAQWFEATKRYVGFCTDIPKRTCASPLCLVPCEYGLKKTLDGCDTCDCRDPCEGVICALDRICIPVMDQLTNKYEGKCADIPAKSSCVPTNCSNSCPYGFSTNAQGCSTCKCFDPCLNYTCPADAGCFPIQVNATSYIASCSGIPPTNCNPVQCRMFCEFGFKTGADGCDICECFYPCENVSCEVSQICETEKGADNVYTAVCKTKDKTCNPIMCDVICDMGFSKDASGCDTCKCYNPCEVVRCTSGFQCKPVKNNSTNQYIGTCVYSNKQCPQVLCFAGCQYGSHKDENGCDTCSCISPCQDIICLPGQVCIPVKSSITNEYIGSCGAYKGSDIRCPDIMCTITCEFGIAKDADGCELCRCVDPCQNIACPRGTTCQLIKSNLTNEVIGQCIAPEKCSNIMCRMMCQFGFAKDINGCQICDCNDPCKGIQCLPGSNCQPIKSVITDEFRPVCIASQPVTGELGSTKSFNTDNTKLTPFRFNTGTPRQDSTFFGLPSTNTKELFIGTTTNSWFTRLFTTNFGISREMPQTLENGEIITPKFRCEAFECYKECQFGYKLSANGCKVCECMDPCENFDCPADTGCQVIKSADSYQAKCTGGLPVQCLARTCVNICELGNKKDLFGCFTCDCLDPCENHACDVGEICRVIRISNSQFFPECRSIDNKTNCDNLRCAEECLFGKEFDDRGCPTCNCIDPCKNAFCGTDKKCQVLKMDSNRFLGICIDDQDPDLNKTPPPIDLSTSMKPNPSAELCLSPMLIGACGGSLTGWFYNNLLKDCRPLQSGCQGAGLNSFKTRADCENICIPLFATVKCEKLSCSSDCQYGRNKDVNGCQTCECAKPCEDFRCNDKEVCVVKKSTRCLGDMCQLLDKGECIARPVCPLLSCDFVCAYGFNKDSNGCDTCSCYDPCLTCGSRICKVKNGCLLGNCEFNCLSGLGCKDNSSFVANCALNNCRFGFDLDSNGCNQCKCFEPCKDVDCGPGTFCRANDQGAYVSNSDGSFKKIFVKGICQACIRTVCVNKCEAGYSNDSYGCPTCACKGNIVGTTSFLPFRGTGTPLIGGTPTPRPGIIDSTSTMPAKCPLNMIACTKLCNFGFEKDNNGCDSCVCVNDPCQKVKCQSDMICKSIPDPMHTTGVSYIPFCLSASSPCKSLQIQLAKKFNDVNDIFETSNIFLNYPAVMATLR